MINTDDSLLKLIELMKQKAPSYFKLLAAQTETDFETAFDAMLEHAVSTLEKNSKNFATLDEVGLTGVFASALSMPGLTVMQEAHSNGHVDLTIEADHCVPMRKKLGEAKIYDGPAYHISGLEQLLGRYTTGREGRGIVIAYVRKKNISDLVNGIRQKMDTELPCNQQGVTTNHLMKWSFVSTHVHSCGESLEVSHVGCNLFVEASS